MSRYLMVIGSLAFAASLGMEIWRYVQTNRESSRYGKFRQEAETLMEGLARRLENPEDCTALLGGQQIKGTESPVLINFEMPESELKVYSATVFTSQNEDYRTEILDSNSVSTDLMRYIARIKAAFVNSEGNGVELARPEPFFVWTTPPPPIGTGEIQSCFGTNSAGALCNDLGGYFIPGTTPYEESCRFSLKTVKRSGDSFISVSNCRIGGVADSPKKCPRYGQQYGAAQLNSFTKALPVPGNKYLCQICQ